MFINKRGIINYNLDLTELARKNRKNPTKSENKVWREILCVKKTDYKFIRQKPIDSFVLDFYCSKLLLAIEIDGCGHFEKEQKQYDICRTERLNLAGIKVLRYKNNDVMHYIQNIKQDIIKEIQIRKKELN